MTKSFKSGIGRRDPTRHRFGYSHVLDECTSYPATPKTTRRSMELSLRWAERCREAHADHPGALFGIVQGGVYADLRQECAERLRAMDFPGYALGGLCYAIGGEQAGKEKTEMFQMLEAAIPLLPDEKPHYLMGVGTPHEILHSVRRGIDMFDCVFANPERTQRVFIYLARRRAYRKQSLQKRSRTFGSPLRLPVL